MTKQLEALIAEMKAAAEKATHGQWVYLPKNTSIEYDVGSDDSQGSIVYMDSGDFTQQITDLNGAHVAAANPENVLALIAALEQSEHDKAVNWEAATSLVEENEELKRRIAGLESRKLAVKIPYGYERNDLIISINEEIAHLNRCVARYMEEGWASTVQRLEQSLLVQQIALSALNSAAASPLAVKLPTQEKYDDPLSAHEAIKDCAEAIRAAGGTVDEGK